MFKIRLALLAALFLLITIFYSPISVTAQNVVTTINLNPESDVPDSDIPVLPIAVGVNHKDNRLYVATMNRNTGENEIIVINSLSNEVIDTIRISRDFNLYSQIEINPETGRVYTADPKSDSDNVFVIDGTTNKIITTINIEDGIDGITVNSMTNRIYVVNNKMVTVAVIDGNTNKIIDVIRLQENIDFLFSSGGIKANSFTNRIYVLQSSIIDRSEPKVVLEDTVGLPLKGIAISNDVISSEKVVIVIDGSTNQIIEKVKLDFDTIANVIGRPFATPTLSSIIYGNSSPITTTMPANSIEINPLTNRIYINVNISDIIPRTFNSVLVMEGLTNNIIDAIDVGEFNMSTNVTTVNPRTNRIYLNDPGNRGVKVIDGRSNQILSSIKTGDPFSIKAAPSTNLIYVANFEYGNISVINDEGFDFQPPTIRVTPETAAATASLENATVTLLDQNGSPLQGMVVNAFANGISAKVTPRSTITDGAGNAAFKFRFNTGFAENNKGKITFRANRLETSITNED